MFCLAVAPHSRTTKKLRPSCMKLDYGTALEIRGSDSDYHLESTRDVSAQQEDQWEITDVDC
jgi:hypothetical protein